MADSKLILAINPGNTSTKIGIFTGNSPARAENIIHDDATLKGFGSIEAQKEYRSGLVRKTVAGCGIALGELSCCVGRGGLLKPLKSGTYLVNDTMLRDLAEAKRGEHASNLGASIAFEIAGPLGIPAFIVDPVAVDELSGVARISGLAGLERESLFHALNHKAVARRFAKSAGKPYASLRLIVAHLGSGISIAAHENGRVTDVFNPRDEGPFSADRAGGLPTLKLARLCYSGEHPDFRGLEKLLFGMGGLVSHLGTSDLRKVVSMIGGGDKKAALVFDAMAYQTAKYIGAMAAALEGRVDAVILTGGMANEKTLTGAIMKRVSFIAQVHVYPGEDELAALAEGALRVLDGEEVALRYE